MADILFIREGIVICQNDKGTEYELTRDSCTCKGFGFRRSCRHWEQAVEKRLFDQVEESQRNAPCFTLSKKMREMRVRAFLIWLKNSSFKPTREMVKDLEPTIHSKMTPDELYHDVIAWCKFNSHPLPDNYKEE